MIKCTIPLTHSVHVEGSVYFSVWNKGVVLEQQHMETDEVCSRKLETPGSFTQVPQVQIWG